jgi:hypothetical protein
MVVNTENYYFDLTLNGVSHKIPVYPLSTQKVMDLAVYEDQLAPLYEKFAQAGLTEKEQGEAGLKAAKIFEAIWKLCVIEYETKWKEIFAMIPVSQTREMFYEIISVMNGSVKKNTPMLSQGLQDSGLKSNSVKRGSRKKK